MLQAHTSTPTHHLVSYPVHQTLSLTQQHNLAPFALLLVLHVETKHTVSLVQLACSSTADLVYHHVLNSTFLIPHKYVPNVPVCAEPVPLNTTVSPVLQAT